ncbi:MAG TPA: GNAT family N-acetyltransferase [Actinomycetota bacterium]|nr:GNAT family N-acetyltransferase [Actinomycetota bacterium]
MLITRASRRETSDLEEFFKEEEWDDPVLDKGIAFIARAGKIIGNVRLIEVDTNVLVIEDILVSKDRRGDRIGTQLVQAAMNSRGGKLYLACHDERLNWYGRLGFTVVDFDALPEPVKTFYEETKAAPHQLPEGHVHHFMTAR